MQAAAHAHTFCQGPVGQLLPSPRSCYCCSWPRERQEWPQVMLPHLCTMGAFYQFCRALSMAVDEMARAHSTAAPRTSAEGHPTLAHRFQMPQQTHNLTSNTLDRPFTHAHPPPHPTHTYPHPPTPLPRTASSSCSPITQPTPTNPPSPPPAPSPRWRPLSWSQSRAAPTRAPL